MEACPRLPDGPGERFAGWAVVGLPFETGHVLALRRFAASSVGPGYTSVWHRAPDGRWTMYVNVSPRCSCPRYFGRDVDRVVETEIVVSWAGPRTFRVVTGHAGFTWNVVTSSSLATRLMNGLARVLPTGVLRSARTLRWLGRLAGPLLELGRFRLHGRVPNGHRFLALPQRLWHVSESTAVVEGVDIGAPGPLPRQARLGDFWIPRRGLLACGDSVFHPATDATPPPSAGPRRQPIAH